jgi:alkylated DNA repair dioxygenase AlkB
MGVAKVVPPRARTDVLPNGFIYIPDFVTPEEAAAMHRFFDDVAFAAVQMRGYTARRRTAHFGFDYAYDARRASPGRPVPAALLPLRARAAALIGEPAEALSEVLVTEYQAGATIGWHRDAPMFGPAVVGVSFGARCRMRFRRVRSGDAANAERAAITLEPRSAYVMSGASRAEWQHSIPAVEALRYSVTFRTVKGMRRGAAGQ